MNLLQSLVHSLQQKAQQAEAVPVAVAQAAYNQAHPAPVPGGRDIQVMPPPRRLIMNMPQVQSPQNLTPMANAQGQRWMENPAGQRFALPLQQSPVHPFIGDQQLVPKGPYNRQMIAAPQYQTGPSPAPEQLT